MNRIKTDIPNHNEICVRTNKPNIASPQHKPK